MSSPRTSRLQLLLRWAVATVAGLVVGGTAVAAPVVIDFEDLAAGGPGTPALVAVTSQYAAKGVTFTGPVAPVALDYSKGIAISGFARSGVKAIEQCYSQEFCTTPFEMRFAAPQNRVKVWLGFRGPLGTARTLLLEAFDASGAFLGAATAALPASGAPRPISIPLQVSTATPAIARAVVRFHPSTLMNNLALDDLEFETTTASPPLPPVCAASKPPTVTLTQPTPGSLQVDEFLLAGSIATETPLEAATLRVAGPGGTRTLDLLARGLVLPAGSSFGPVRVNGLLSSGSNGVSVSAKNCSGTALASGGSLVYSPIPASTRFQLLGMEVTQAIQDISNSVRLIADKRTLVRVYLRSSGATVRDVRATLVGCRQLGDSSPALCGDPLPPLASSNAVTVDATTSLTDLRRDLTRSLNFELPPSWIKAGRVHHEIAALTVAGVQLGLACDDCQNPHPRLPAFGRFYEYTSAPPVEVSLFEVGYGFGGDVVYPRKDDVFLLRSWLERAYPTSRVIAPNISLDAGIDGLPSCNRVNLHLIIDKLALAVPRAIGDAPSRKDRYYGLVSDAGGFVRGCARPRIELFGFTLAEFDVGSGPTGVPGNPNARHTSWDMDKSYGDWYGAHEIGHLYGRNHPDACLDAEGRRSLDRGFPFPGGLLSGPDLRYFGFDFGEPGFGLPRRVYPPDVWTDVMGYCDNQWISNYTYEGILGRLKSAGEMSTAKATTADGLVVVGTLDQANSEIELENLLRLPNLTLTPRPARSAFTLVLQDAAKRKLASYPFTPRPSTDGGDEIISEVIPFAAGTRRVAILQDGRELAARTASRNAPQVKILFPNGGEQLDGETVDVLWQGSDADGDAISYSLLYSNDRGASWGAIAINLREPRATVELARLPGGSSALFRVVATDGFHTQRDDSDAPFAVPGKAPEVRIKSPGQNAVYEAAQTIVLVGEALDAEDGSLASSRLQWSSDRQGTLGVGRTLAVTGLAAGRHRINLTGVDRGGTAATAGIDIEVIPLPPRVLAGAVTGCQASAQRLCLQGGRFAVTAEWRDFIGRSGAGQAVPLSDETGYFWFFGPANVEVVFKLLDGRPLNGHWWAFYASLSNVEFRLTVTDTRSGESKSYFNPSGRFASVGDTAAFLSNEKLAASRAVSNLSSGEAAAEPPPAPAKASCAGSATSLCLQQGRFALEISWRDFAGRTGSGQAVPLTSDTGYFWFFDAKNVEVIVKVLDGRPLNDRWWVFYGSLSNVEYTIRVTDTMTGATRTYHNPLGRFGSAGDTAAF